MTPIHFLFFFFPSLVCVCAADSAVLSHGHEEKSCNTVIQNFQSLTWADWWVAPEFSTLVLQVLNRVSKQLLLAVYLNRRSFLSLCPHQSSFCLPTWASQDAHFCVAVRPENLFNACHIPLHKAPTEHFHFTKWESGRRRTSCIAQRHEMKQRIPTPG